MGICPEVENSVAHFLSEFHAFREIDDLLRRDERFEYPFWPVLDASPPSANDAALAPARALRGRHFRRCVPRTWLEV
jgi:hypothetical protein